MVEEVPEENPKEQKFTGEVIAILPLAPALVVIQNDNEEQAITMVFMNEVTGDIFDIHGPIDEGLNKSISKWIETRNKDMQKQIISASPEQIKALKRKRGGGSDGLIL